MNPFRTLIAILLGGIPITASMTSALAAANRPSPSCPSDPNLSKLVAGSNMIIVGGMAVPKLRLAEETAKASPQYLDIPTGIIATIKGDEAQSVTVRFYPKDTARAPSNAAVLSLADTPAILFLTRVDQGEVGNYFAGYTPNALQPASEKSVSSTRAEVDRQAKILQSWRADSRLPHFDEVRHLVAQLGRVSDGEQQRLFERIEALGTDAVPAIIAQMDDRRALRTQAISLANHSPEAWEGARHYAPEQVVDGLDAVLNQITGESFGSIVSGGSNRQRAATVAGWRIYASDLSCRR